MPLAAKAPEIEIPGKNNKKIILSDINYPYTLVIFWASWCPHCMGLLPELKKIYEAQQIKKLEIFAISIDTFVVDWNNSVRNGRYRWINCTELKGWNSKTVKDYYIYSTPAMFLLDANKRIKVCRIANKSQECGDNIVYWLIKYYSMPNPVKGVKY